MEYPYAPYYCEENIYRLAELRFGKGGVVFISNPHRTVAVGAQRVGRGPFRVVVWDYHVIYVESGWVYDPDSLLDLPVPEDHYVRAAFPGEVVDPGGYLAARFACVPAKQYLEHFSSDRGHMRNPDGTYKAEPPPWPPVYREEEGNNLFDLMDGRHRSVIYYGPSFAGWEAGGQAQRL